VTFVPLYTADALILRTYKLGEADRIVVFLTRDRGKKRGVAKGARRPRSRFAAALEPLTEARVAYFEKEQRELVGLNYAETVRSPLGFAMGRLGPAEAGRCVREGGPDEHIDALGYLGYFAELLDEWAQLRVLAAAAAGRVPGSARNALGRCDGVPGGSAERDPTECW
jgi:DNA repair protein RecO (recombination protein O)